MKKLLAALLVAVLCMAAPAVAVDWDNLPAGAYVQVESFPGDVFDAFFDISVCEDCCCDVDNGCECENFNGGACSECTLYPGWCVDTENYYNPECYCAELSSTLGAGPDYNMVNWVLNNKGEASYQEIQAAIWIIMGQEPTYPLWVTDTAIDLVESADDTFIPGCDDVYAVLVTPCDGGQLVVIEVEMPPCPTPVPEFPAMVIPVFFIGGVLVAASVLKRD